MVDDQIPDDEVERAAEFLLAFAKVHYEFLGVHVVAAYARDGHLPLFDGHNWRRAAAIVEHERIIVRVRFTPAGAANPPQAPIWRSLVYRGNVANEEWSQR